MPNLRSGDLKSRCRSRVPVSAVQIPKDPAAKFLPAPSQKVGRCFKISRLKSRRAKSRRILEVGGNPSRRRNSDTEGGAYTQQDDEHEKHSVTYL
ncbi:hypothetical protein SCHPADRAFT_743579 [Schizopora paradoxa]|uniref:Uncharacterized protein n=1 Tax=Schizopora paradoxa TaxID=27342 RepID=A0A0H2RJ71_9AGAM|nr:hypothetical protein SCHPADRAFT_743579 [Schizopora paradoxa]